MRFQLFIGAEHFEQAAGDSDMLAGQVVATLGERNDKGYLLKLGCADKWIAESGGKCHLQRQHSDLHVIGEITGMHTAASGTELRIGTGEFYEGIQAAGETKILMQRGALQGFSLGFNADPEAVTIVEMRDPKTQRWTFGADFDEIEIVETSVVTSPGDKTALIQAQGDGIAALRKYHQDQGTQPEREGGDMTDITIDLIKDAVDKRVEQAAQEITGAIDIKFSELDTGIENKITQSIEKARSTTANQSEFWKKFQLNGANAWQCEATIDPKYVQDDYASPTVGGATTGDMPVRSYHEMNFVRPFVRTVPIGGGAVVVPKLAAITFAEKGTQAAGAAAESGGVSATTSNVKTMTAQSTFPTEMDLDIPGFRNAIAGDFMKAYQNKQLADMLKLVKDLKAARQVSTGVAADLPALASIADRSKVVEKFYEVIDHVGREYFMEGDMLAVMSGYARGRLGAAIEGGFAWDETRKMQRFDGHPFHVTGVSVDRGNTQNAISMLFGNWMAGMTLYERTTLDIQAFRETRPGYITFYAEGRYIPVVQIEEAFATFITKA